MPVIAKNLFPWVCGLRVFLTWIWCLLRNLKGRLELEQRSEGNWCVSNEATYLGWTGYLAGDSLDVFCRLLLFCYLFCEKRQTTEKEECGVLEPALLILVLATVPWLWYEVFPFWPTHFHFDILHNAYNMRWLPPFWISEPPFSVVQRASILCTATIASRV